MVGQPQSTMPQILWVLANKRAGMSYPDLLQNFTQLWPAEPSRRNLTISSIQHIWTRYKDDPAYNQDWAPDQIAYILGRRAAGIEKADIVAGVVTRFPFYTWPQHVLKLRCLDFVVAQHGGAQYDHDWDKHDVEFILDEKLKGLSDEEIVWNFSLEPTLGRRLKEEEVEYIWARYGDDPEYSHHFNVIESIEDDTESTFLYFENSASEESQIGERSTLFAQEANLECWDASSTAIQNGFASIVEERRDSLSLHGAPTLLNPERNSISLISKVDPTLLENAQDCFSTYSQPSFVPHNLPQSGNWASPYPNFTSSAATSTRDSAPLASFQPGAFSSNSTYSSTSPLSEHSPLLNKASSSAPLLFSEASHLSASTLGGHNHPTSQYMPFPPSFPLTLLPDGPTINNLQLCTVMQTPAQFPPELMYIPPPHDLYYWIPDEATAGGIVGQVVWDAFGGSYFLLAERVGSGENGWMGWPLMTWKLSNDGFLLPHNHLPGEDWRSAGEPTNGSEDIDGMQCQDSSRELDT